MKFVSKIPKACAIKKSSCKLFGECNHRNSEQCRQGTCYAFKGKKQYGETCNSPSDCGDKLACETSTQKCKKIDACNENSEADECVDELKCFGGSCRGPGKKGEQCRGTLDCEGALVCYNKKCADRNYLKSGEKCSSFIECGSAICEKGICDERWNGKCTNDADCSDGKWCYPTGAGHTNCCPQGTSRDDPCRLG